MSRKSKITAEGNATAVAETQESKSDKFIRLAEERVSKAIQRMRMIAQLANKNTYEYSSDQAEKIVQALHSELDDVIDAFAGISKTRRAFSLSD